MKPTHSPEAADGQGTIMETGPSVEDHIDLWYGGDGEAEAALAGHAATAWLVGHTERTGPGIIASLPAGERTSP